MDQKIIWIVFFVVLALFGFAVAVFPLQVARLIGAPRQVQEKPNLLLIWRVLGALVLVGASIELALLLVVGHVVR